MYVCMFVCLCMQVYVHVHVIGLSIIMRNFGYLDSTPVREVLIVKLTNSSVSTQILNINLKIYKNGCQNPGLMQLYMLKLLNCNLYSALQDLYSKSLRIHAGPGGREMPLEEQYFIVSRSKQCTYCYLRHTAL